MAPVSGRGGREGGAGRSSGAPGGQGPELVGGNSSGGEAGSVSELGGDGGTLGSAGGELGGVSGMIDGGGGAGGVTKCAIAAGTSFQVNVLSETNSSHACHVAHISSEFEITAGTPVTAASGECTTPMNWAPPQQGVQITRCVPSTSEMLGVDCEMIYPSHCAGLISFYFANGANHDWGAAVIEGALLRIEDAAAECLPNISGCLDEYLVRLERL
jgi:hypothetical protein